MWWRSRKLSILTAASYLLVITGSALFHNHYGHGEEASRPGVSAADAADDHDCSVCQFLAQKPAPAVQVAPEIASALVQDVAAPAPWCPPRAAFAAWQSRAPPAVA
jgi:hypothetical protein